MLKEKKNYCGSDFMTKIWKGEVNIPTPPGIELNQRTFNIKHDLHKSYLHKRFIFTRRLTK